MYNKDIAIAFSKSLRKEVYSKELCTKVIDDLFFMIRNTKDEIKIPFIKITITSLCKEYDNIDFTDTYDVGMFAEDIIGNLAYLYHFDKYTYC